MHPAVEVVRAEDVRSWDESVDVLVVGYGIAGACAALEARRCGVDVLVVERAGGGGGASAVSSGIFYLGGGTPVQEACGYEDDPQNMYRFLMASTGAPDASIVRAFCDASVEHFGWLEAQGMPFERTCFEGKSVVLNTTTCLFGTGNEKVWPYRDIARPVPRGHKVAGVGEHAGAVAMEPVLRTCADEGIAALYDSQVTSLVVDDGGRVVGARARQGRSHVDLRAAKGVVLGTGGFNLNREMCAQHLPLLSKTCEPLGIPYNDGAGIELGSSVGAGTWAMDGMIATGSFYPPGQLIKGILVNARGERFVAEDSYHGRTAAFVAEQPEQRAYLVVDAEIFAYPKIKTHRHQLVDGWETIAQMEQGLDVPKGSLEATLAFYNEHAANGEDPQLFKAPEWLKPIGPGPYAAFDVSFDRSVYLFMALGGLRTNADAQVLSPRATVVDGLYAAGACAAHIPQSGKGYASGMSLGPGSYFGRVAGRHAAMSAPV